jgi:hypothetical protein
MLVQDPHGLIRVLLKPAAVRATDERLPAFGSMMAS